jgi:hypothetical protein
MPRRFWIPADWRVAAFEDITASHGSFQHFPFGLGLRAPRRRRFEKPDWVTSINGKARQFRSAWRRRVPC